VKERKQKTRPSDATRREKTRRRTDFLAKKENGPKMRTGSSQLEWSAKGKGEKKKTHRPKMGKRRGGKISAS